VTAAELAEKLERFALGPGSAWAQERTGEMADAMKQAAALISAQAEEIARLEEAAGEVWDEAYAEGAGDTAGWEKETSHAVLQWLDKNGDGFDIHHPDGNTTDAIIQGLYDAKRSGNLTELRQAAARLRSMEEALKEAHEAINLAMTIAQGRFPATARKAPLEVLADAERKARAALAGVANGQV
jgi:hypothetical protein